MEIFCKRDLEKEPCFCEALLLKGPGDLETEKYGLDIDITSTSHRNHIAITSTSHRHHIDFTSTSHRHHIDMLRDVSCHTAERL